MKIAHKLTLASILLASLTWGVGFYAVAVSRRALQDSVEKSSMELAAAILNDLDHTIHTQIDNWRASSADPDMQQALKESNRRFEELPNVRAYIDRQDRDWTATAKTEVTPFMKGLVENEVSEEMRLILESFNRHHRREVYGEAFVTNRFGANVALTSKTSDYRQDDEQWWQQAWKNEVYVGDVEYDESADVYSVNVCVRIDDAGGNSLGVIKAVLDIEWLLGTLRARASHLHNEAEAAGHAHHLTLLTADGKILFSSCDSTPGPGTDSTYGHDFDRPGAGRTSTFQRYDDKRGQTLAACAFSAGYDEFEGLGWILIVEHRMEDVLAPARALRNSIIIASALIAAAGLALGLIFSFSLSRRIARLRDAAVALGRGNLKTRIEDNSRDEVGQLALCFNEMGSKLEGFSDDLRQQAGLLEQRVNERTGELTAANEELQRQVAERRQTEEELRSRTHDLGERVKELKCLHGISRILEEGDIAEEETIRKMLALIPQSWQYPQVTCARFVLEGKAFETDNFEETLWKQGSAVFVGERLAGALEVCYLQEMPREHEGPFLEEERALIDGITERLGAVLERRAADREAGALKQQMEFILGATRTGLHIMDAQGYMRYADPKWQEAYGDPSGRKCCEYLDGRSQPCGTCGFPDALETKQVTVTERLLPKENNRPVQVTSIPFQNEQGEWLLAQVNVDISERKRMEAELAQAQKLESIGQLAAGIAHEINTPSQYIGDNTRFLQEAFNDLDTLLGAFDRLLQAAKEGKVSSNLADEVEAAVEEADVEYLSDEIPKAIRQSLEGVDRVAAIVKAMKEFSHPGGEQKQAIDLNRAIENTVTVSRNEWKYVADLTTDLDPALPLVHCHPSEINQVVLNVIVNAAQAIGEVVGESPECKGTITIRTRHYGDSAEVSIADTGSGIPEEARSKVFDHFFTTKEVGKGTGQGLTIARSIVVEKHGGTITFETEFGRGTTFIVRLPIADAPESAEAICSPALPITIPT